MSFINFHAQVECVLKCTDKVELTTGDMRFMDPFAIIRFIYFVETLLNVLETSILYQKWHFFLSLLVRSYMSITPGSANLEILIK